MAIFDSSKRGWANRLATKGIRRSVARYPQLILLCLLGIAAMYIMMRLLSPDLLYPDTVKSAPHEYSQNITVSYSMNAPATYDAIYIINTDNFTLTLSENITLTDLTTVTPSAAAILGEGLGNELQNIIDEILLFVIIATVTVLAFWQQNVFLYLLAVPVNMTYGLTFAANSTTGTAAWICGIMVAIIGTFFLFKVAVDAWPEIKRKRQ